MGLFEGFPFVSKEERERRRKDFENRMAPYGVDETRDNLQQILKELFPSLDQRDSLFVFYDTKDSYTKSGKGEEGLDVAKKRMSRLRWIDERNKKLFLTFIEMESEITSLDEYPTAKQVLDRAFPEEVL